MSGQPSFQAPTEPRAWRSARDSPLQARRSTPSFRQSSAPLVQSPLQQSFPAYNISHSHINIHSSTLETGNLAATATAEIAMPESSSRPSRPTGPNSHRRSESRSASAPGTSRLPPTGPRAQARFPAGARHRSRRDSPTLRNGSSPNLQSPTGRPSVKHLTCHYWWFLGSCSKSDEECLYAHYDTGRYADKPQTIVPGQPARAGRSLQQALHNNRSHSNPSLPSLAAGNAPRATASSQPITPIATTSNASHPPSPVTTDRSSSEIATNTAQDTTVFDRRQSQIQVLVNAVVDLQARQAELETRNRELEAQRIRDSQEVDALRCSLRLYQLAESRISMWANSVRLPVSNPWGPIGSERNSATNSGPNSGSGNSFANSSTHSSPNPLMPVPTDDNPDEDLSELDEQDINERGVDMLPRGILDDQ
jgi:hypothetical protein